ncbi:MAG TPA: TOBE domain-containing protein, partial [Anaerolineae bacterium]
SMGDRIAVMSQGGIMQCDSPIEVYNNPATHFIGSFIGNPPMNFLTAGVAEDRPALLVNGTTLPVDSTMATHVRHANGAGVLLGIRAENIEALDSPVEAALPATVLVVEPLGSHNLLTVQVGAEQLKVNTHADAGFRPGQDIWLRLVPDKIRLINKETGQAI